MQHKQIFETDGIRGIPGKEPLTADLLQLLGQAIAAILKRNSRGKKPLLMLARDTRASGTWMAKAIAAGVNSEDLTIADAGIISTPALAYLVPKRKAAGGIVISASHNPPEFNGVKVFAPNGGKAPESWERAIEAVFYGSLGKTVKTTEKLKIISAAGKAADEYIGFLVKSVIGISKLTGIKAVLDCANGATSKTAPVLFNRLGIKATVIHNSPNGKNINVKCGSQYPEKVIRLVKSLKADIGIAFDGDGDRAVFVDEKGNVCDGDHVLAVLAKDMKKQGWLTNSTVVTTVMANGGLLQALKNIAVKTVCVPVGDREVAQAMTKHGSCLGGEQSGHIIFKKYLPTGDGLLTALQVLSVIARAKRPLSELAGIMVKNPQVLVNVKVKEKIPLNDHHKFNTVVTSAKETLGPYGRVFVRYSGTEPVLRIMVEGPETAKVKAAAATLVEAARASLPTVN